MNQLIDKATWTNAKPRRWQREAFSEIKNHFNKKDSKPVIVSAVTGSGKSFVISEICKKTNLKDGEIVVILVPTLDLVTQMSEDVGECGQYSSKGKWVQAINIVCYQSYKRFLKEIRRLKLKISFLIIDEAHRSECDSILKTNMKDIENILGFTATPYRTKEYESISIFEKCIFKYSYNQALNDGVVVPIEIKNWTGKKEVNDIGYLDAVKESEGKGMVNASSVADAKKFNDFLNRNGVKSKVIYFSVKNSKEIKREFEFDDTKCLVYVNMLKEGVNIPCAKWLVLRRNTTSRVRFVQEIGRVMRSYAGKKNAVAYDFLDLFGKFNVDPEECLGVIPKLPLSINEDVKSGKIFDQIKKIRGHKKVTWVGEILNQIVFNMTTSGLEFNKKPFDKRKNGKKRLLNIYGKVTDKNCKEMISLVLNCGDKISATKIHRLHSIINRFVIKGLYLDIFSANNDECKVKILNEGFGRKHLYKKKYYGIGELAKMAGVASSTMDARLKKMTVAEAVRLKRQAINTRYSYKGKDYSARELAKMASVSISTMNLRLKKMSVEHAVSEEKLTGKKHLYKNKYYLVKELAEMVGIGSDGMARRMKKMSVEDAVNLKRTKKSEKK